MRLIDADALMKQLQDFCDWCKDGRKQGADFCLDCMIPNAPTIEIVRCKDCKNWWETEGTNYGDCNQFKVDTIANDFCSYGERREL